MRINSNSDRAYLLLAYYAAMNSPDPSTQNGAVITYKDPLYVVEADENPLSYISACNKFPEGVVASLDRLERPLKYTFIEHAERGVIYEAAKQGISLEDKTMYVPWAACADCARAIICSGIKRLVTHQRMMDATPDHWKESIKCAFDMFKESGVEVVMFQDELPDAPKIRFNGVLWQP